MRERRKWLRWPDTPGGSAELLRPAEVGESAAAEVAVGVGPAGFTLLCAETGRGGFA